MSLIVSRDAIQTRVRTLSKNHRAGFCGTLTDRITVFLAVILPSPCRNGHEIIGFAGHRALRHHNYVHQRMSDLPTTRFC